MRTTDRATAALWHLIGIEGNTGDPDAPHRCLLGASIEELEAIIRGASGLAVLATDAKESALADEAVASREAVPA